MFRDIKISIPEHADHTDHRNKKDIKMSAETDDTSIEPTEY